MSSSSDKPASSRTGEAPTGGVKKTDKKKGKLKMGFYKLRWSTFKNYKVRNVKEVIEENFKDPYEKDVLLPVPLEDFASYGVFHILLYRRIKRTLTAKTLPSFKTVENIRNEDLIFFFTEEINPKYAFCMCSGFSYMLLEGHTESQFYKKMAKRFMDGSCITSVDVVCIAGPSISEHLIFSPEVTLLICGNYEKVITSFTARIRKDTELEKIICDGKPVLMKLGLKHMRIYKSLDLATFSNVFKLFIEADKNPRNFSVDPILVAALDHTEYIRDPIRIQNLEEKLLKDAQNPEEQKRVYLSYKKVEDWTQSSDIEVMQDGKTIQRFTLAPTFDAIRENCKLPFDRIEIAFTARDTKKVKEDLKSFLHGSTECEGKQCHKVAGKWYWLSDQYRGMLANRMAAFLKSNLIKQGDTGYLPLPWKPRSLPEITITFESLSKITREQLLVWLKNKKVAYLGKDKKSCLTGLNCKFIESTSVYADLKDYLSKQTKNYPKTDVLHMISGLEHAMMVSAETNEPLSDCIKSCSIKKEEKNVLEEKQKKIIKILQEEREVIDSKDKVVNPNVTKDLSKTLYEKLFNDINTVNCAPDVIEKELFCYLRTSCTNIAENDYNETYQSIPKKDDGSFYMLGDRVQGKVLPELFDVLYYKTCQAEEPAKLYLYHVKEGFGQKTRDACSQIRVSANLLWHDLMDSSCTLPNIMKYRELALGYKGNGICRIMLKQAMESWPEERFKSLFREVSVIVYVYAFMEKKKKDDYLENVSCMSRLKLKSDELDELKLKGYVDRDEFLTDSAFLTTKESFMEQMKGKLTDERLEYIHDQMSEQTEQNPSTIALVELTTLAEEFNKFQCSARRLSLKVCQISTCNT